MANLTKPADVAIPTTEAELRKLVDRARKGDEATLPALRKMLELPDMADRLGGDLARQAEWRYAKNIAGPDVAFRESVLRKVDLLRAELAGPDPSPIERLLAERAVACWLQVQDADLRTAESAANATYAQSEHQQRRQDRCHKRYLQALRTLALVRRLALPCLQVNIAGKQQVNNNATPSPG